MRAMVRHMLRPGAAASVLKAATNVFPVRRSISTRTTDCREPKAEPASSAQPHPLLPWWPKWRGPPPVWGHGERSPVIRGPTIPLLEYMKRNPPFQKYRLFGEEENSAEMQTEKYRRLKDSFSLILLRNQDLGQTFYDRISAEMFTVDEHGNVQIREGTPMRMATPSSTILEFIGGADFLAYLQSKGRKAPLNSSADVQHFLDELRSPVEVKGYMLSIHVTLMPLATRSTATIEAHDFIRYDLPPGKKHVLLQYVGEDSTFEAVLRLNFLLKKWVDRCKLPETDKEGWPTHPAEKEIKCLRNLECHQLINKREVVEELCRKHFEETGVPATTDKKNEFSYTKYHLRNLVYYKKGMTLHRVYHAIRNVEPNYFKVLMHHNNFCIACKFCHLADGCLRSRLFSQMLNKRNPQRRRQDKHEPPASWRAITMLKVLRILNGGYQPFLLPRSSTNGNFNEWNHEDIDPSLGAQQIALNFPHVRYGIARMNFNAEFEEMVDVLQGERVIIYYDDEGWFVVRKSSTNNAIGIVHVSCLFIEPMPH